MRFSNREIRRMMKKAGIVFEEVKDVSRVDIVLNDGTIIRIIDPVVAKMKVSGQVTYQITGKEEIVEEEETPIEITEEDIKIVMEQAGVDRDLAIKALEMTGGDIAEAIMVLKEANF